MPLFELTRDTFPIRQRIALSTALQNLSQAMSWHVNSIHVHLLV